MPDSQVSKVHFFCNNKRPSSRTLSFGKRICRLINICSDQLKFHTSLKSKTDRVGIVSLLGPTFRENLTRPLVDQSKGRNPNGVDQVIDFLDHYDLTKEDMDNIIG